MQWLSPESRRALKSGKGIFSLILIVVSFAISIVTILAIAGQIGHNFAGFRVEPTLTVSAVNESYWEGPKAGLKTYDRILAMNGQTVKTPADFWQIVKQTPVGSSIDYTIQSKGEKETHQIPVKVTRFSVSDFSRSFLTLFIVGLLHLIVGAVAYLVRPDNPAARAHLYMTTAIGVTTLLANDYDTVMLFPRLWIASVALTGGACLHLGLYFPHKKKILQKHSWIVYIPYIISFLFMGAWQFAYSPEGLAGYQARQAEELFQLHFDMYDLSLAWSLVVGFLGLFGLITHSVFKAESQLQRNQAKVALIGALIAYIPMSIFWMIMEQMLHIKMNTAVATICWILFIVFPVSIAYAIIKHKMFDIEFVIKQSMIYTSLVLLLGSGYVLVATTLQQTLRPLMASYGELTAYMLTTSLAVLIFEPLKLMLRDFIDSRFFRKKYDFRTALSDFVDTARSTINKEELIPKLVDIMEKTIHPKHILLFLKNPESEMLQQAYAYNINIQLKESISAQDPVLLTSLGLMKPRKRGTTHLTSALSLGGNINAQAPIPSPIPLLLAKRITSELPNLEEIEAVKNSLTLPLTVKVRTENNEFRDELIGLLTLGEKRSELEYTVEDRQLFQSIGQQLALTLHSSQLAEEVAEKEAIKQTLQKARLIQKSMLPSTEMELSAFEVHGFSESADETGGDYYDWYDLGEGKFIVGLGDVTGHGIDAALVVGMAKSCLYNQVVVNPDAKDVMIALNRTIHEVTRQTDRQNRKLMSFIYAYYDSNDMTCRMASAGHWFPYLYRARTGELTNFPEFKGTFPLGQRTPDKFKCEAYSIQLEPDDVMLFFTDGLHEAESVDGKAYDLDRVERMIGWYKDLSANEIKEKLVTDWENHIKGRGMDDDMTLVVVKASSPTPDEDAE